MGELLADHTTLRLGGSARQWLTHVHPADWTDLARTVRGPVFTLGGGSNTVAPDAGYDGTVIHMATRGIGVSTAEGGGVEVTVQAGEDLSALVAFTVAERLSGIEYLGGIPGMAGAAPVQNTGAYGQQIADTLTRVSAYDWQTGRTVHLTPGVCAFGYRTSLFKSTPGRFAILALTIRLTRSPLAAPVTYQPLADQLGVRRGTRVALGEAAAAVLADRAERGLLLPDEGPDARQVGSVFLNPTVTDDQADAVRVAGGPVHRGTDSRLRASAGWLLEHTGHHPGQALAPGVYCSSRRTLTLTARAGATATAFVHAAGLLAARVRSATGIRLHVEPACLGLPSPKGAALPQMGVPGT
ncbi:UDP-N-acetylmuramate dehydrogenase [Streptomyces luteireticuli]|uniref:UDP-N-acetylmuramate dehydrogenase n=1 Tax=Streptomyces luteireticuli TaxID=173858 RepID=UPI0035560108